MFIKQPRRFMKPSKARLIPKGMAVSQRETNSPFYFYRLARTGDNNELP
jgi:hypothetical protein